MDIWLFLLGYLINFGASALLLYKIRRQKSIYGLSVDTQICFCVANVVRVVWTLETRLIDTKLAYVELLGSTAASIYICYLCVFKYYYSTTEHAEWYLRWPIAVVVAGVLAFFFNPSASWWTSQILVAFTMYIEALALVPQLYLMQKMHDIEPLTSHYVAMLILARAVRMVFWATLFWQGDRFLQLFISDILHTLFAGDYVYLWVRRFRTGGRLTYAM